MAKWNGSVEYMPDELLESSLAEAKQSLADLSREAERRSKFTPEQKLADRLHQRWCRSRDCDYAYGGWNGAGISQTTERGDYLRKATELLRFWEKYTLPVDEMNKFIDLMARG